MSEETIRLSVHTDEHGCLYLTDQYGRRIEGVRKLSVHADYEDITTFDLHALAYDDKGSPYINRQKRGVGDE